MKLTKELLSKLDGIIDEDPCNFEEFIVMLYELTQDQKELFQWGGLSHGDTSTQSLARNAIQAASLLMVVGFELMTERQVWTEEEARDAFYDHLRHIQKEGPAPLGGFTVESLLGHWKTSIVCNAERK